MTTPNRFITCEKSIKDYSESNDKYKSLHKINMLNTLTRVSATGSQDFESETYHTKNLIAHAIRWGEPLKGDNQPLIQTKTQGINKNLAMMLTADANITSIKQPIEKAKKDYGTFNSIFYAKAPIDVKIQKQIETDSNSYTLAGELVFGEGYTTDALLHLVHDMVQKVKLVDVDSLFAIMLSGELKMSEILAFR